jgi:nitrate reductase gamma subunit
MGAIQIITYLSLVVFVVAVVVRFVKLSRHNLHLRWELYPVAHEKGRAHYGGSYFEEPDWWTKPRHLSKIGELKVMIPEIGLLSGVYHHNKKHWLWSWPFHFGLYMSGGLIALLLVGGIAMAAGANISATGGFLGNALHHVTYIVGYIAFALTLTGALGLLGRRMFNPDYSEYATVADYFNLLFFIVAFAVALLAHIAVDHTFIGLRAYFASLVTLNVSFSGAGFSWQMALVSAEIVLASFLVAYIPVTHMSHFFTKIFTYHNIRWNDEPNIKGGRLEKQIIEALQYPVSWSADHIRGDGRKTWVDVATSPVEEDASEQKTS